MIRQFYILMVLVVLTTPALHSFYEINGMYKLVEGEEDPFMLLKNAESIYRKDTKRALDLIEEALVMALRQNNLPAQGASYELLGDINHYLKQYDLAAANYQRALEIYRQSGNFQKRLEMLKLSGESYELANELDKALTNYRQYVNLAEGGSTSGRTVPSSTAKKEVAQAPSKKYKSLDEVEEVRLAISEILLKQQRFKESVQNLDEIADRADTVKNPEKSIIINDALGEAYEAQEMDEEAVSYYSKNAITARKLNIPAEEAKASSKIADIYDAKDMTSEALNLRNRSIEIYNISNDTAGLAQQYLARGKLEKKIQRPTDAENSLKRAIDYSIQSGEKQVERDAYNEISGLEEDRGRTQQALEYYKKYVALQDEAFRERQEELEKKLELNSSLNQQQQRIDLLEKNEEINNKTIEILRANQTISQKSATNQRLLIYGLLIVILLLSISGYLMFKNMRRKRVANQLLALKSLRSQMNPHFIFNALNSVNHYISQQDERAANKYLSDFSRLMRNVLENSQEDFITLGKELEIIELYLNLEHNRFKEKFEYELEVDGNLDKENILVPPMLVQPYVENAIWHGLRYRESKGYLSVKYLLRNERLHIVVEDNGIGREQSIALKTDNQKKNNSTGMSNIESRVKIINSMYHTSIEAEVIDLPENSGTRIEISVPLTTNNIEA